ERTAEIELGFEAALLGNRAAVNFTYYYQKTSDALFRVNQVPSSGYPGSRLTNVGQIDNRGIELASNAVVLAGRNLGWDLGFTVYTNHSRVLSLGGAPEFFIWPGAGNIANPDTLPNGEVEYYSVPEITWDCVIASPTDSTIQYYTSTVTGQPTIGADCHHGPNLPTTTLGFNTTIRLPKGIELSARGEFHGGHFILDLASWNALRRGVQWPFCFEAYEAIDAGQAEQVSTWLQSACIRANVPQTGIGTFIYPADFFKVREMSLRIPVTPIIPGSETATLMLSARNAIRWVNADFPLLDPEMMGNSGMLTPVRYMTEHIPQAATFSASLRVLF
ncbi:TonB-dependent receptor domain-containing protein, partial [Gemmatimonadota bacterium]